MALSALLPIVAASCLLYLGNPNQRLFAAPIRRGLSALAWILLAAGTTVWIAELGPAAGIATSLACTMAVLVLMPYLGWWRQAAFKPRWQR